MEEWLAENLVCPDDYQKIRLKEDRLVCPLGHTYPYIDGIPIMLLEETQATYEPWCDTFEQMHCRITENGRAFAHEAASRDFVDPFVQQAIAATNGQMYRSLIGALPRYPIPELRLPSGRGQRFLDIGCNWGRWCISAARKGYIPVGIDPSVDAIRAARRVARQLGLTVHYVVADARHLPFVGSVFDVAFSYSVLQHLDKEGAKQSLAEIARTLKVSGTCLIQLPNIFGLRSLHNRCKRAFRQRSPFEVSYYTPSELKKICNGLIGPTALSVDGYFSLNAQTSDKDLLPLTYRLVVSGSTMLRKMSERIPGLMYFADSLYITSTRATV